MSRGNLALFAVKSGLLKLKRAGRDVLDHRVRRLRRGDGQGGAMVSEVITPLYTDVDPNESGLQLGKIQNLRVGARLLNGVVIPAGIVFSFWAHIGRPTKAKGFVIGRELRQGCLIPTLAGGLCQLSNSLFQVVKCAGCEIIERHGHSAPIPNSPFPEGEDATVFWNYVDLRFRSARPLRLCVTLDAESLIVRLEAMP